MIATQKGLLCGTKSAHVSNKKKKRKTYDLVQQVDRKAEKGNLPHGRHDTRQRALCAVGPVADAGEKLTHGDHDHLVHPDECQHKYQNCQNETNENTPGSPLDCELAHLLHRFECNSNGHSLHPGECAYRNDVGNASAILDGPGCGFKKKTRGHSE